jgi:hypothetical protein
VCAENLSPSAAGSPPPMAGSVGGVRPPSPVPLLKGSQDMAAKVHTDSSGRACLTVHGTAVAETINPNIFNHLIQISSNCSLPIKLQICYYHTQNCILVVVPAYARKEATLGIMPAMKEFRFEYRERFDDIPSLTGSTYRFN